MPAQNPLVDPAVVTYNTGLTDGMNSGTTVNDATLSSGAGHVAQAGGNANFYVGGLVAFGLLILLGFHLLGFRFGFDVSVGRK